MIVSVFSLLKNKYLVNSAIYMAGSVLSQALSFLVLPIFTRYLTLDDYGILNYTNSIMTFLLILSKLSLNGFVIRHYFELKSEKQRKELFGTIFLFLFIINIGFLFLEFLTFPYLLRRFSIQIPFHPYFKIALLINFLEIIPIIPEAYYRVTQKAWGYFWLTSVRAVLGIGLGLILVIGYNMGIMGRYYGNLYINLIFLVICTGIVFNVSKFSFNASTIRKGLGFSLPLIPGAIALVAIVSADKIILERYVPLSHIGIYSVGVTLGSALSIIVRGFFLAIEPEVYAAFNQKGFDKKIIRAKNNFLGFILCLGCLIIVFSREIVMLAASGKFYESYTIIPFFVIGTIFRGAEILAGRTLVALNKTLYQPLIIGAAFLVNIIGNLVFIPFMGIRGAALASTGSCILWFLFSIYVTNKFVNIQWNCLRDTFLIGISCGASLLVMQIQLEATLPTLLMKIFLGLPISLIAFYCFLRENQVAMRGHQT